MTFKGLTIKRYRLISNGLDLKTIDFCVPGKNPSLSFSSRGLRLPEHCPWGHCLEEKRR